MGQNPELETLYRKLVKQHGEAKAHELIGELSRRLNEGRVLVPSFLRRKSISSPGSPPAQ